MAILQDIRMGCAGGLGWIVVDPSRRQAALPVDESPCCLASACGCESNTLESRGRCWLRGMCDPKTLAIEARLFKQKRARDIVTDRASFIASLTLSNRSSRQPQMQAGVSHAVMKIAGIAKDLATASGPNVVCVCVSGRHMLVAVGGARHANADRFAVASLVRGVAQGVIQRLFVARESSSAALLVCVWMVSVSTPRLRLPLRQAALGAATLACGNPTLPEDLCATANLRTPASGLRC